MLMLWTKKRTQAELEQLGAIISKLQVEYLPASSTVAFSSNVVTFATVETWTSVLTVFPKPTWGTLKFTPEEDNPRQVLKNRRCI